MNPENNNPEITISAIKDILNEKSIIISYDLHNLCHDTLFNVWHHLAYTAEISGDELDKRIAVYEEYYQSPGHPY